jgi:putative flippase GtrA
MKSSKQIQTQINNSEKLRYLINGLLATAIHYVVLNFNILILDIKVIGLANLIGAIFGISASFVGSRYFVYRGHNDTFINQGFRFVVLYGIIALFHGGVLYFWSDIYQLNYHLGFIVATALQMILSYSGNKIFVFKLKKPS